MAGEASGGAQAVAEGTEGAMSSKIDLDDVKEYAIGEDSVLTQSYSLTYINLMCSFCKLNKNITMGFSENMPMSFIYDLDEHKETTDDEDTEMENTDKIKKCFVGFYLAPKLED